MSVEIPKDCSVCRFHSKTYRPKVVGESPNPWGEDDAASVEFDEGTEEVVFHCRGEKSPHNGKEIGAEAIECPAWEEGKKGAIAMRMEVMQSQWENRWRRKPSEEE